jgi:beta-galactosidase
LWKFTRIHDYVAGDFMWTGIDYLGETRWPSKNTGGSPIDLCGFIKDEFYFYQSQWTQKPVMHILPHWTWPGKEGEVIPVICYTNCDNVELFLNNKSFGEQVLSFPRYGMDRSKGWGEQDWMSFVRPSTADLHLRWTVPYEPGVLSAVGKRDGLVVCEQKIVTAGAPAKIKLSSDREVIKADGYDVAHLTVEILDADGNPVPTADNLIYFSIRGPGRIVGVDNGNPVSHESFQSNQRQVFNGLCLAIIQSTNIPGILQVTAQADSLVADKVNVKSAS